MRLLPARIHQRTAIARDLCDLSERMEIFPQKGTHGTLNSVPLRVVYFNGINFGPSDLVSGRSTVQSYWTAVR